MKKKGNRPPYPWTSISVLALMALVLTVIIVIYSSGQKRRIIEDAATETDAVARLKADQVAHWRKERINDARLIHENVTLVEHVDALFIKDQNLREKSRLVQLLNTLIENYDFGGVLLLDAGGRPGIAVPESEGRIGSNLKGRMASIIANPEITLSDFHMAESVNYLHLDLVVPMKMPHEGDTVLAGILIIRIDPEKELFPLISTWPTPENSSQCILFRFEGDSVRYLNSSRLPGLEGHTNLMPSGDLEKSALNSSKGDKGSITFRDYRGAEVVASVKQVPGMQWYLAATRETSEILERFNHEITMLWIIMVLIYLALYSIGHLIVKSSRVRYMREKYREELNRQAIMKHLDFVMKNGSDIILLTDSELTIVEANDRALETYGYERSRFIGMNISELRTAEEAGMIKNQLEDLVRRGTAFFETVHKRSNGSVFPIEISAHTIEVEGVRYFQTIGRDITDRKRAENEMRESNKKLNTIINNLRGVVFRCANDDDWTMHYISDGIYELSGHLPNEFINNKIRSFDSIIAPEDRERKRQEVHEALSTGYLYTIEYRIITSAGNTRWVWERGRGYYESDRLVALEGFISDITDRKRIEDELIRAKDKAEQSDRLKTAFLHNISHEIRTPMNAIVGFTTLLDSPDTTDDSRKQYIDIIYQASNQLLSIITDIVDISNIETGLVKLTRTRANINHMVRILYEQYRIRAQQQSLAFMFTTHLPDSDCEVITDETKVIQVFSNLLNNALKFTKRGKIEFGYVVRGDMVEFFVSDTGIGIAPENQSKVFERFYQVELPNSKQFSGTGLGLSISKAYVELLGGRIWVISTPGEGSLFCFSIPYERPAEGMGTVGPEMK